MVLKRKGMCVADCGLYYQSPKFRRWGYQLRRVDQRGTVEVDIKNGRAQFSDVLYEQVSSPDTRLKLQELLRYTQWVTLEPHGLLVRYEVLASHPLAAGLLGAYLHLPVRLYAGAPVRFFPGFASGSFPKPVSQDWAPKWQARRIVVAEGTDREVQAMLPNTWHWIGADQRPFRLNTYRVQFAVPLSKHGLRPGKPVSFEFRLVAVGPQPRASVAMGGAALQVTPGGCLELRCGAKPLAQIGPLLKDPTSGGIRSALMESFAAMPGPDSKPMAAGQFAGDAGAPSWSMSAVPSKGQTTPDGEPRSQDGKARLCSEIAIGTACSGDRGEIVGLQVFVDQSELVKLEPAGPQSGEKTVMDEARILLASARPRGLRLRIERAPAPVQKRKATDLGAQEFVFPFASRRAGARTRLATTGGIVRGAE